MVKILLELGYRKMKTDKSSYKGKLSGLYTPKETPGVPRLSSESLPQCLLVIQSAIRIETMFAYSMISIREIAILKYYRFRDSLLV